MRGVGPGVRPTPLIAGAIFVGFFVLVAVVGVVTGVDFSGADTNLANTVDAARGLFLREALYAVAVIAVTTWLGWWRPVLTEENRLGGWFRAVPFVYALALLVGVNYFDFAELGAGLIVWIALACLTVGFVEETVFRGLMVVGLRGGMSEPWVCFLSALLFGLVHFANVFSGMDTVTFAITAVLAFVGGVVYYVVRRTTGTLLVPILLHAGFDFMTLATVGNYGPSGFARIVEFLIFLAILATIRRVFRPGRANTGAPRVA